MYVGQDFSIMNVGDDEVISFDFVKRISDNDSVLSASWSLTVAEGVDPDPSSHLDGSAGVTGTKAMQRVSGLLPNVNYIIEAAALTSLGNTVSLYSHIRCEMPT